MNEVLAICQAVKQVSVYKWFVYKHERLKIGCEHRQAAYEDNIYNKHG